MTRPPDLEIDLTGAAHPSRSARKEMRRFLATRAVALVEDAGVAVTEVVRTIAKNGGGSIIVYAWFDQDTSGLRVEVVDRGGDVITDEFPVVAALSTSCGTGPFDGEPGVWFEMQPRVVHDRRGRTA
jgi:hypothetical protein